jgi:signal transduction histidine kinase
VPTYRACGIRASLVAGAADLYLARVSSDPRIDKILEGIVALARHDFAHRIDVTSGDEVDAIAAGLNMLAEELAADVASRRELEAALAEREAAEAGLVHAGRLAVLGQVAGGVGHEINNPVTWITLGLSIISREVTALRGEVTTTPLDEAVVTKRLDLVESALRDAREGMDRIRVIANDLRTFARPDDAIERVCFPEVVATSVRLVAPTLESHAKLTLDLRPTPDIYANRGRIAQIATNLLINAGQALGDHDGPRAIAVTTMEESGGALLVVEDSGPGVPEELRARIFRPFFTTKSAERGGTGLGLALVRQIVDRCQGDVRVSASTDLGGARFEVWLPSGRPRSSTPVRSSPPRGAPGARPRILVVDDEAAILRSMRTLYMHAIDVEVASGGREAIERLSHDLAFDLVLCDVHMPEVDGLAVLEWLEGHAPLLARRVVLCSGATQTARVRAAAKASGAALLEKPIAPDAIDQLLARFTGR